jgi:hypothetical protein
MAVATIVRPALGLPVSKSRKNQAQFGLDSSGSSDGFISHSFDLDSLIRTGE